MLRPSDRVAETRGVALGVVGRTRRDAAAAHGSMQHSRAIDRAVGSDPCVPLSLLPVSASSASSVLALGLSSQSGAWRDPSPHQVRRVTVEPAVQLEALEWGGSGPPVVLLACYVSAHVYDEFAPKLTNQFHVYGITRRGIGASDKPATGYAVQRSVNDVLEVLNTLKVQKSILVGHSCAGQVLTMFAAQHSDRLLGLVYLDGAGDPTMTPADVGAAMPDPKMLPRSIKPPSAPDNRSFEALRASQQRDRGWAFPEGELRQQYEANADGSVGRPVLSPVIRRAITFDDRVKPDYSGIRVPCWPSTRRTRRSRRWPPGF